jgi:methionyl aminopeptidase
MDLNKLQQSANIHHNVQNKILDFLENQNQNKINLFELKKFINNEIKNQFIINNFNNIDIRNNNYGIAFPTCLSVDNIAAHFSPNDDVYFDSTKSILKIDYGVHINGNIIDSAFNYTKNEDLLLLDQYSIEATNIAIKEMKIDTNIYEISAIIEEYINSLELNINNNNYQLKSFEDLCGHKIGLYKVHDNVPFPNIDVYKRNIINRNNIYRLKENDYFAIEPYLTTGNGKNIFNNDFNIYNFNYHKINNYDNIKKYIGTNVYKKLPKNVLKYIDKIQKKFNYLPFELTDLSEDKINIFKSLLDYDLFEQHGIVGDVNGSFVAQTEKNVYITNSKTIVL